MAKSIIQQIKFCANKLKNSKLARLGGKEISEALDNLTACLGLETREEAIVFIPIFEKECSGRTCDFDEMSTMYDCSNLDMMEYSGNQETAGKRAHLHQHTRHEDLQDCRTELRSHAGRSQQHH